VKIIINFTYKRIKCNLNDLIIIRFLNTVLDGTAKATAATSMSHVVASSPCSPSDADFMEIEQLPPEEQPSDAALEECTAECARLASEIDELPQVRKVKLESKGPNPQQNRAIAYLGCHNGYKWCRNADQKFNVTSCTEHDERIEGCETCQKECHDHLDVKALGFEPEWIDSRLAV
jgi:hypothetical protein